MEFIKNWVKEIWDNQPFVSSQMDGIAFRLVTLENVAFNFSHFIIEHWIPAQAILVKLHDATCPTCQRADAMANNGSLCFEPEWSGWSALFPVPLLNSWQGEAAPIIVLSPPTSLTSPLAQLHHSSLQVQDKGSKKHQGKPYSLMKHHQQCWPSLVAMKGKLEAMKTFQRLQKVLGMGVALEVFQKVLVAVEANMYHDAVGCPNCCVSGPLRLSWSDIHVGQLGHSTTARPRGMKTKGGTNRTNCGEVCTKGRVP